MLQTEYVPRGYETDAERSPSGNALFLRGSGLDGPVEFSFEAIRPGLFRTTFTSVTHPLPPHPNVPRVESSHGTRNNAEQGTTKTNNDSLRDETIKEIHNGDVVATVEWSDTPLVSLQVKGASAPLHADLPFRSYVLDGSGVAHYTRYNRNTLHVGLGEKAAPMNLSNRRFAIDATDCFGYDVYRTDPMYKHIPLLINATPEGCVATFSSSHSRGSYNVGAEMDGLWGHFKTYRQDFGGLEEYLIIGKTLKEVVHTYAELAGFPLLVPRWAFGYIAGGMKYSMLDEPRAADALMGFADKLIEHDIPCSGFQMSSGYTIAEVEPKTRNVFTWNYHRFPDPKAFVEAYKSRGIRLMLNIKPYVMATHPEYQKLKDAGALFTDPDTKKTAVARLWSAGGGESAEGSHLDLTSAAGFKWWYEGVKALRELGVDCMWNDNNEYVISNDYWQCKLDEKSLQNKNGITSDAPNHLGLWGRSLHTELMAKASHDAMLDVVPHERPFVLTRSATPGTMRYCASTWSGDNVTSWDGMRGANAISLTAGMCLLQCYGHDIGGFEGPQPSPELLVRWVQLGIYSSRFAINCFKTSPENNNVGDVIEPWMYPEITPLIRKIVKRRYEIMPYVYSLALESHMTASPPQRWVGWGYENDKEVWDSRLLKDGETQYWLGDSLLIGGVYEPGLDRSKMYLPAKGTNDPGYLNTNAPYQYLSAGQWVDIESKWDDSIPVIAKVGGAVFTGKDVQTLAPGDKVNEGNLPSDDYRGAEIFPPKGSSNRVSFTNTWYEDDGIALKPDISSFRLTYSSTESQVTVSYTHESGAYSPEWKKLHIILPVNDTRSVVDSAGKAVIQLDNTASPQRRCFVVELASSLPTHSNLARSKI